MIKIKDNYLSEVNAEIQLELNAYSRIEYFNVEIKDGQNVFGLSEFTLQKTSELTYGKIAFIRNAEIEGLLAPVMNYVYVYSEDEKGIYLLTEQFPQSRLKNRNFSSGFFVRIDQYGKAINAIVGEDKGSSLEISGVNKDEEISNIDEKILQLNQMLADYQYDIIPIEAIFDIEKFGKFYALLDLWNVESQRDFYYFNPKTELLEPIFVDLNLTFSDFIDDSIISKFVEDGFFSEPLIRESYGNALFRITEKNYLPSFRTKIRDEETILTEIFELVYEREYDVEFPNYWEKIIERSKVLSLEFTPYQNIRGTFNLAVGEENLLEINITNLMMLPVEIRTIGLGDKLLSITDDQIMVSKSTSLSEDYEGFVLNPLAHPDDFVPEPLQIIISLDKLDLHWNKETLPEIKVITRIAGINTEFSNSLVNGKFPELVSSNPLPVQPSLSEVLKAHPFLDYSEEDQILVVFPGEWEVNGDLILPDGIGIKILAGTTLRFGEDKILFSNAPIQIKGNSDEPVYLTAQNENWGGIAVIQAGELSAWKYVTLDKIRGSNEYGDMLGIVRGAWVLTSGINFYYSPLQLDHSRILNMNTEDAINLIHSEFVFDSSEFAYSYADAFDSDFSNGEIKNCSFHDIGGDAIDASGSEIMVKEVLIQNIQDKGISAGEESTITVQGGNLEKIAIGVASKDLSEVILEDVTISEASTAALAAYIKKNVFGPARITATNLLISNSPTEVIVQTGCEIRVDGETYQTIELDVKDLYEKGILGN